MTPNLGRNRHRNRTRPVTDVVASFTLRWGGLCPLRLVLSVCLLISADSAQAALSAHLDRGRITEGDTVQLLVEAHGQVSGSPDTSVLEKDFDILGVSSGSRINVVNGRMDSSTSWTLTLSPKHSGVLTIPPLEVGGERTRPLTLRVTETTGAAGQSAGGPILIETEADRTDPYVQGMVLYTVRLLYRVKLAEGSLSEPSPDNALVRRLGKDREYSTERGGQTYRVLERRYAIFPQASGELVLPGPVLDARVETTARTQHFSRLQDLFGSFPFGEGLTSTRPTRARGKSLTLKVRPRPDQATGADWLPAQSLVLTEDWQPEAKVVHVGEPLTRSLTLHAVGVTGEQLPDLEPGRVDGLKVYPDRANADTQDLDQGVEGEKTENIAYVPTRPGSFVLPRLSLHWWDTRSDRERVAELPERTVHVLPGAAASASGSSPAATSASTAAGPTEPAQAPEVRSSLGPGSTASTLPVPKGSGVPSEGPGYWPWITALFALLWLATLGLWRQDRRRVRKGAAPQLGRALVRLGTGAARRRFLMACQSNDAPLARSALLAWAAAHWPEDPPGGLDDLARRLPDSESRKLVLGLDRALYRGDNHAWDGSTLGDVLSRLPARAAKKGEQTPLPDLYT